MISDLAKTRHKVRRAFRVGTTGWRAADLDDPSFEARWSRGSYEIVEGVLAQMPPAYYDPVVPFQRLFRLVDVEIVRIDPGGVLGTELDIVLSDLRVVRTDAAYLSPEDRARQKQVNAGKRGLTYGRILVAPTLVIESVSIGHEVHDRVVKRRLYAEAGVPHYWVLDAYARSLECLVLEAGAYRVDATGRVADHVRPSMFPGLDIPLATLWAE